MENEEDINDCQEGNKTPFTHYSDNRRTINDKRAIFDNHEVMMYQSPKRNAQY